MKFCFSNQFFFKKKTIVLQNFLIKSRIHTIKQHKNFNFFLKITDRSNRKKKMSKILKKLKRQIVNDGILKMFCI